MARRRPRYVPQFDALEDRWTPSCMGPTLPPGSQPDLAPAVALPMPGIPPQSGASEVLAADALFDAFPGNFHPPVKLHGLPVALRRHPLELA